jgi:hypothetical protein
MSLSNYTPIEHRYICIICPNCEKPEQVPVYKVKLNGAVYWVCRGCMKWFARE